MKYKVLGKQNNTDTCFVCGMMNDAGAKAQFINCKDENDENALITVIEPKEFHQSYPNRMHGGVISALLDESMGRAIQITDPDIWAVTIDLNTKFRKPTPLNQTLYIESKVTERKPRYFDAVGKLFLKDGTVCATGSGRFFIVPYEEAFPFPLDDSNWFQVKEDLPEYLDL